LTTEHKIQFLNKHQETAAATATIIVMAIAELTTLVFIKTATDLLLTAEHAALRKRNFNKQN
jgi:hypothetical protein